MIRFVRRPAICKPPCDKLAPFLRPDSWDRSVRPFVQAKQWQKISRWMDLYIIIFLVSDNCTFEEVRHHIWFNPCILWICSDRDYSILMFSLLFRYLMYKYIKLMSIVTVITINFCRTVLIMQIDWDSRSPPFVLKFSNNPDFLSLRCCRSGSCRASVHW